MTRTTKMIAVAAATTALLAGCGGAQNASRDQIRAVGSSTVYPFAKVVANSLSTSNPDVESPIIESTGTGAGMKLFCGGVGAQHPDVVNASRRMKLAEYENCAASGVKDIVELQVGLDGLAFATSTSGTTIPLTTADVYEALAANPYGKPQTAKTWKDVNPDLPAVPILVYGPPSTSGTRDSLKELVLVNGCDSNPEMKALKESDKEQHEKVCTEVRNDGAYVDAGENDNLIVQKLEANPKAMGVFGFSYLEENADKLKGLPMNGVMPTYETVSNFSYPGARAMFIYVKKAHVDAIKGLKEFVAEWPKHWGPDGALARAGMIVSPEDVRAKNAEIAQQLTLLDPSQLK